MILLTLALHPEARPLIARFRLQQDTTSHAIPVFRRDDLVLAVSGVGKLRAAIATTYLISRTNAPHECVALNIGIAGCTQDVGQGPIAIGHLFLAHKLVEASSGREFFPDILTKSDLAEATVTTVDRPLLRSSNTGIAEGLVDMEATGFFLAAATFLPPHQIGCLKIVSDFLETERFDKAWVSTLIEAQLEDIERIINVYRELASFDVEVLDAGEQELLTKIRVALRLTASQSKGLTDAARGYKLRKGSSLPDLTAFTQCQVTTKQESKTLFDRLRQVLSDESLFPPVR